MIIELRDFLRFNQDMSYKCLRFDGITFYPPPKIGLNQILETFHFHKISIEFLAVFLKYLWMHSICGANIHDTFLTEQVGPLLCHSLVDL